MLLLSALIQLEIQAVEIEIDASAVVSLLTNNVASYADYAPIVDGCRILMKQITQKSLNHCYREANSWWCFW